MTKTSTREKLKQELEHIPDDLLGQLHDYMKYLQYKKTQENFSKHETAVEAAYASETVLAKDWNSPEEDQAWKDL